MKAIDVRLNRSPFNKYDQDVLARISKNASLESKIKQLKHNGCPYRLGKWFTNNCNGLDCDRCWEQTPYQYKGKGGEYYDK